MVLKASNRARRGALAFNGAADRIETQLRRYIKRLREQKVDGEQPYVENAAYTVLRRRRTMTRRRRNPAIIAETRVDIPEASVSDAVMMLDLRNTNALMFKQYGVGRFQHGLSPGGRKHRLG